MSASGTYNSNATVQTLANVLTDAPNAKGVLYSKKIELGAAHYDDFKLFEGPAPDTVDAMDPDRGNAIFWAKRDLTKGGGDKMTFTVASDPGGPGVRGETELTGNTSSSTFATYDLVVDFKRDAVEMTKKQKKFLAVGETVEDFCSSRLAKKMGLFRMWDMKMCLINTGDSNTVRPNGRRSFNALTSADTLEPGFLTAAKPQLQRIGGLPLAVNKNGEGSPVHRFVAYFSDVAGENIRASTAYQNALQYAADRGDKNPTFTGRLVDWNNLGLFEHISVHPDWDDVIGDPCAPIAKLGTAFGVDSAHGACKLITNSANTKSLYYQWFRGYDYLFTETQSAAPDATTYYAWIVNPDRSVGFVSYVGTGNNGNQITLAGILSPDGAGTSTIGSVTLGNLDATGDTWDSVAAAGGVGSGNTSADFNYTDTFLAGAYIIPANANGAPDFRSFLFGRGAAIRGYGSTDVMISQDRDYGFVKGVGYENIFGQRTRVRTDDITHGYLFLEHTGQHQGLEVPSL